MVLEKYSNAEVSSEMSDVADASPLLITIADDNQCKDSETVFSSQEHYNAFRDIKIGSWSVPCILMTGICFVMSPIMVCIGTIYIEQCPKQPYIPIFLVVAGALTILSTTMNIFIRKSFNASPMPKNDGNDRGLMAITNLLHGITFSWYIAGCIWIYGAFQPEYHFKADMKYVYCNRNLYLFAFWLMSSVFILIGILFVAGFAMLVLGIIAMFSQVETKA